MAIAGQTIATAAPSRASPNSSSVKSVELDSSSGSGDKPLNNKDFSSVLSEQEKAETQTKPSKSAVSNKEAIQQDDSDEAIVSGSQEIADSSSETIQNGNLLPAYSAALPVLGGDNVDTVMPAGDAISTDGEPVDLSLGSLVASSSKGEQSVVKEGESDLSQKPANHEIRVAVDPVVSVEGSSSSEKGGSPETLVLTDAKVDHVEVTAAALEVNPSKPGGIPDVKASLVEVPQQSVVSGSVGKTGDESALIKSLNPSGTGEVKDSVKNSQINTVIRPNSNVEQPAVNTSPVVSSPVSGELSEGPIANSPSNSATQNFTAQLAAQFELKARLDTAGTKINETLVDVSSVAGLESVSSVSSSTNTFTALSDWSTAYKQPQNTVAQVAVPIEVGKPGWSDGVMAKVMWMSSQQISKAEIALDPPELGPLQVRISTQSDQTSVVFTSNHGAVRDALDQGLPRLREMMENQGLDLADVDVSGQRDFGSESHGDDDENMSNGEDGMSSESNEDSGIVADNLVNRATLGLVDHYV